MCHFEVNHSEAEGILFSAGVSFTYLRVDTAVLWNSGLIAESHTLLVHHLYKHHIHTSVYVLFRTT